MENTGDVAEQIEKTRFFLRNSILLALVVLLGIKLYGALGFKEKVGHIRKVLTEKDASVAEKQTPQSEDISENEALREFYANSYFQISE